MTTEVRSRRPDGTLRPAVRVREGYVPPEEQAKYSDQWKDESQPAGIPGMEYGAAAKPLSKTAAKNKRRNEAARKKKEVDALLHEEGDERDATPTAGRGATAPAVGAAGETPAGRAGGAGETEGGGEASEVERKLKALRKRLRQVEELEERKANGATLNPDQMAKVASKERMVAEIAKWETVGDVDVGKKIKALKKKVRQIEELEERVKAGETLNEDQQGKVDSKKETVSELGQLEGMLSLKL